MKKVLVIGVLIFTAGCGEKEVVIPTITSSTTNTTTSIVPKMTPMQYEIYAQLDSIAEPYKSSLKFLTMKDTYAAALQGDLTCRILDTGRTTYEEHQKELWPSYGVLGSRIVIKAAVNNMCVRNKEKVK